MTVARSRIVPTGRERFFEHDEIIVSKTDLIGRITYANRVFLKVSGYSEAELLGAPHSVIRHPDMPRAVFKLLWDRLALGNEVFAYVNNMARSGDHYWVLAHVTPSVAAGGRVIGYHSNRRVPDPSKVALVEPVYTALRAEEAKHEDRVRALQASTTLLQQTLHALGKTYDEWIWSL